jgi:hypothetical protein
LQTKRFKNNNNPELGSERENTSKPKKSSKFRRGRRERRPHKQTSSGFMELIFSLNHQTATLDFFYNQNCRFFIKVKNCPTLVTSYNPLVS